MIGILSSSPKISGAEIVLRDHLMASRHEYILIIPKVEEVIKFFSDIPSVSKVLYLPCYMRSARPRVVSRLRNLIVIAIETVFLLWHLTKGDLRSVEVLYGSNSISCLSLGIISRFTAEKHIVLHIHDMMTDCSFRLILERIASHLNTVTVSEACAKELIEHAGFASERITIIYNGIDQDQFTIDRPKRDASDIRVGYAGNLIPRKGVVHLAKAYRNLAVDNPALSLVISSHLRDEAYFKEVAEILRTTRHHFESHERKNMPRFYNSLDVLVVPSVKDPLPTTVLEAMSCGLVVIASRVDGIPEMLPSQYLFEPGDPSDLEDVLASVIANLENERALCSYNNPRIVAERFSKGTKIRLMDEYFDRAARIAPSARV